MRTKNLDDWTHEEILEGVGETFDGMVTQKFTKNEALYPLFRNALRWLVISYIEELKREEEEIAILQKESGLPNLSSGGEKESLGDRTQRGEGSVHRGSTGEG